MYYLFPEHFRGNIMLKSFLYEALFTEIVSIMLKLCRNFLRAFKKGRSNP